MFRVWSPIFSLLDNAYLALSLNWMPCCLPYHRAAPLSYDALCTASTCKRSINVCSSHFVGFWQNKIIMVLTQFMIVTSAFNWGDIRSTLNVMFLRPILVACLLVMCQSVNVACFTRPKNWCCMLWLFANAYVGSRSASREAYCKFLWINCKI